MNESFVWDDSTADAVDNEWLDAIGTRWKTLTGKCWETRDDEIHREAVEANVSALFEELERVQAQCAEMREVLEKTRHYHLGTPEGIPNEWFIRRDKVLATDAGTGYVRKEDVVPLVEAIESAVKNCFFCRGTGAITKAADRMSAEPPPLPHECQDCKPLREALAHAKAKGFLA